MTGSADPPGHRARVVLLAGPSGSGKTFLALKAGLPVMPLDDFYRPGTDPDLPRSADGSVDWDDPRSWDAGAACDALAELCRTGRVEVPNYVFGEDRAVGHRVIELSPDERIVVAEGIFAAELIAPLRRQELLADALLIEDGRWRTYGRRLLRDLHEARKSPWYLVRQGWRKTRAEPEIVSHLRALGARPVSKPEALQAMTAHAETG